MQNSTSVYSSSSQDTAVLRDQAGVAAAVLCAVHCAVFPLAAGLLSVIGLGIMLDERVEFALLMLAGLIGVWSLWPSYRQRHGRLLPLLLFVAGLLVMASARLFEEAHASLELPMVLGGAATVAIAHLVNLCWCRRCTVSRTR